MITILVKAIFADIYAVSDQLVFTQPTCGGYNTPTMNDPSKTLGHAFGCALDLKCDAMCKGKQMIGGKVAPTTAE